MQRPELNCSPCVIAMGALPLPLSGRPVGRGAAPNAPFHGFIIYFGSGQRSRLNFEIHIRVELPEDSGVTNKAEKRTKVVPAGYFLASTAAR